MNTRTCTYIVMSVLLCAVGIDFLDPRERLSISESQSFSVTVFLETIDDELAENTESLTVRIIPDDDGVTEVDPELGTATLLIVDNDSKCSSSVLCVSYVFKKPKLLHVYNKPYVPRFQRRNDRCCR